MSNVEAVYSPDDGGWYATRYPDAAVTAEVFATKREALDAARRGEWDDPYPQCSCAPYWPKDDPRHVCTCVANPTATDAD